MAQLARVVDTDALALSEGPRATLAVNVPADWLDGGARVEVTAPRLLACDRCDGGGCDGCDRSGALRGPEDASARILSLELPSGHPDGLKVRLAQPFAGVDQLVVVVRVGGVSDEVRLLAKPQAPVQGAPLRLAAMIAIVIVAGLLTWWLTG